MDKNGRRKVLLAIAVVCIVCISNFMTVSVWAAEKDTQCVGIVMGVEGTDNKTVFTYPAFGVNVSEPCAVTGRISDGEIEASDRIYFVVPGDNDSVYEIQLQYEEIASGSNVSLWKLKDVSQANSNEFADLSYPQCNEKVTAVGFCMTEGNGASVSAVEMTLIGWENGIMEADTYPENILYPVPLLNAHGEVAGILLEGNIAWDWLGSEEIFYGMESGKQEAQTESGDETADKGTEGTYDEGAGEKGLLGYGGIADNVLAVGIGSIIAFLIYRKKKTARSKVPVQPDIIQPSEPDRQEKPEPAPEGTDVEKPMLWIVAKGGYMNGRVYQLEKQEITIGRNMDTDICYPKKTPGVSRIHAKIYWQGGKLMLMDCNSTSGTFVKRLGKIEPMKPEEIKPGDVFYIGEEKNGFEVRK